MTFRGKLQNCLAALSFLAFAGLARAAEPPAVKKSPVAQPKAQSPAKPRVLVTISKETTYITEPLRPDGYPDYLGALNQRFSRGVTPENNSAVLFWKAMGPDGISEKRRGKYFQMLGVAPPPEKGDYYITAEDYITREMNESRLPEGATEDSLLDQLRDRVMRRPWSSKEFPFWAHWLAGNERPLATLVEASKRPRRYDPLLSCQGDMVYAAAIPAALKHRDVATALAARAMFRLGAGKPDDAWEDLLACHRLARLAGQGPTLVEGLTAMRMEEIACAADQSVLGNARLTSAQIVGMRKNLTGLPPMLKMIERINTAERFTFLDVVTTIAREGLTGINRLLASVRTGTSWPKPKRAPDVAVDSAAGAAVDWDLVLRMGNSWYDRIVDADHKPTRAERAKAVDAVERDLERAKKSAKDNGPEFIGSLVLGDTRKVISERMGNVLSGLFVSAIQATLGGENRAAMSTELNGLAFALAAYHADHNSYPAKLGDLVPKYAARVPKDIFNHDAELRYTRQGDGYLLYSVGQNGRDDGGRTYDEGWDDLVVRVPAKP